MSYTRPASTTADFSFAGDSAYTRPASTAADVSFLTGNQATGFTSTVFGAPSATGFAEGFTSTAFGTAIVGCIQPATGFSSSQLPIPSVPLVAENASTGALFGVSQATLSQRPSGFYLTIFGLAMVEPRAAGFLSGGVSIPSIPLSAESIPVTVVFGTAYGQLVQQVSGFSSTLLGTPKNLPIAVGFGPALLGVPSGSQFFKAASLGPQTVVSGAFYSFNQTLAANGAVTTIFGNPFAIRFSNSVVGQLCQAYGFWSTVVPAASALWLQTGQASGVTGTLIPSPHVALRQPASGVVTTTLGTPQAHLSAYAVSIASTKLGTPVQLMSLSTVAVSASTTFGTPISVRHAVASGWSSLVIGSARAVETMYATGFTVTSAGTAKAQLGQTSTSVHQPTRFGLPGSSRSHTYLTYGIDRTGRIGQPSGFVRINRMVSGSCSTVTGTPTARERSWAAHMASQTRFGQPLLTRAATC